MSLGASERVISVRQMQQGTNMENTAVKMAKSVDISSISESTPLTYINEMMAHSEIRVSVSTLSIRFQRTICWDVYVFVVCSFFIFRHYLSFGGEGVACLCVDLSQFVQEDDGIVRWV